MLSFLALIRVDRFADTRRPQGRFAPRRWVADMCMLLPLPAGVYMSAEVSAALAVLAVTPVVAHPRPVAAERPTAAEAEHPTVKRDSVRKKGRDTAPPFPLPAAKP